ncbi:hypothetical protein [Rodentibacter heidelbergensis]|uniref:Uncharacterized protein n=1 Tax=Rodentibacter heidelbergensis TaxID=1908258 RepID=A0A1V3IC48_9PAST|nr:hypothetical protein [Rodentibacter heidelbergensis]OOF37811.1 hypothetical protein BKK48_00070 [Rodentibacter heidelbergensis]
MKKSFLTLVPLLFSPSILADEPFFDVKLGVTETVVVQGKNYISFTPLTDLIFKNMIVNDGACLIGYGNGAMAPDYSTLWESTRLGGTHEVVKGKSGSVYTTCDINQINKIELVTDKGRQIIQYNLDTEPVITIKKGEEIKKDQVKKADPNLLNQLYNVSNYTCYQTKDEIDEIIELCTILPTHDITEFALPGVPSTSKIVLTEFAKEEARKARYIELLETYPKEKPKFETKRLPSKPSFNVSDGVIRSGYDPRKALVSAESDLARKIKRYESKLEELVDLKIRVPKIENEILNDKKLIAKIKSLKEEPSPRVMKTLQDAEYRLKFNLFKLEGDTSVPFSEFERKLEEKKRNIQEAKEKVMTLREEVKKYLQDNSSETQTN